MEQYRKILYPQKNQIPLQTGMGYLIIWPVYHQKHQKNRQTTRANPLELGHLSLVIQLQETLGTYSLL